MTNHDQFDELLDRALSEYRDAEPLSGLEDRVLQRLQSQPVGRRHAWWTWGAIATCAALILIGVWIGVENSTTPHLPTAGKYGPPTQPIQAREQVSPPVSSLGSKEVVRVTKRPTPPKVGGVGHPAIATTQETASKNPVTPRPAVVSQPQESAAKISPTQGHPTASGHSRPAAPVARAEAPVQSAVTTAQFPTPAPLTPEEHALLAMLHANPDALPKAPENSDDTTIAPLEIKPLAGSGAPTQENRNE